MHNKSADMGASATLFCSLNGIVPLTSNCLHGLLHLPEAILLARHDLPYFRPVTTESLDRFLVFFQLSHEPPDLLLPVCYFLVKLPATVQ